MIDVGAGTSTLVDALLDAGWSDLTVLDTSARALDTVRQRLGMRSAMVSFVVADVRAWTPLRTYDCWHDRAVFHFLVDARDRDRYVATATRAVPPGGTLVIATFAPGRPRSLLRPADGTVRRGGPRGAVPPRIRLGASGTRGARDPRWCRTTVHVDGAAAAVAVCAVIIRRDRLAWGVDGLGSSALLGRHEAAPRVRHARRGRRATTALIIEGPALAVSILVSSGHHTRRSTRRVERGHSLQPVQARRPTARAQRKPGVTANFAQSSQLIGTGCRCRITSATLTLFG